MPPASLLPQRLLRTAKGLWTAGWEHTHSETSAEKEKAKQAPGTGKPQSCDGPGGAWGPQATFRHVTHSKNELIPQVNPTVTTE